MITMIKWIRYQEHYVCLNNKLLKNNKCFRAGGAAQRKELLS